MIRRTTFLIDDNDNKKHYFVFSVVEHMLPSMQDYNIGAPFSRRGHKYDETKGWGIALYVDEIDDDMDIFSPINTKSGTIMVEYPKFVEEPKSKENLYISERAEDYTTIRKVLPHRNMPYFVHCYIDKEEVSLKLLNSKQYINVLSKLCKKQLGFDITEYQEHIGNIYEVHYNTILSGLDFTASDDTSGLIIRLSYVAKQNNGLSIRITERHHKSAVVYDKLFYIPANKRLFFANLPFPPHNIELRIYDKDDNLVYFNNDMAFIRSFDINILIQRLKLRIKHYEDGEEKDDEIYPKFVSVDKNANIIDNDSLPYTEYFRAARMAEKQSEAEDNLNFIFFDGDSQKKEENVNRGRNVLQNILNRTRHICYICDPYFNERDFYELIYKMKRMDVEIRIINCRDQLLKTVSKEIGEKGDDWQASRNEPLVQLDSKIEELKGKLNIDNIECRVRLGRGDIHDRFIFADKTGWTLGSSFSELGNRCTVIQKIPEEYSPIILHQLETWWNDNKNTKKLNDYVKELPKRSNRTTVRKLTVKDMVLGVIAKVLRIFFKG